MLYNDLERGLYHPMDNVPIPHDKIEEFCRRRGIRKLAFFGSVVRADFRPESDIDVLVEFEPESRVGFFELFDMEQELSRLLGGRKVELNTPNSLSKYFRQQALHEAQVEYVEA
jgi:predicted nucleotidyltransferase